MLVVGRGHYSTKPSGPVLTHLLGLVMAATLFACVPTEPLSSLGRIGIGLDESGQLVVTVFLCDGEDLDRVLILEPAENQENDVTVKSVATSETGPGLVAISLGSPQGLPNGELIVDIEVTDEHDNAPLSFRLTELNRGEMVVDPDDHDGERRIEDTQSIEAAGKRHCA